MLISRPLVLHNNLEQMVRRFSALVIIPLILLSVVVPSVSGMVSETFEESQVPAESEEEREEAREEDFVSSERRFHSKPAPIAWAHRWRNTPQPRFGQSLLPTVGHRLSYDLLAPMTC